MINCQEGKEVTETTQTTRSVKVLLPYSSRTLSYVRIVPKLQHEMCGSDR